MSLAIPKKETCSHDMYTIFYYFLFSFILFSPLPSSHPFYSMFFSSFLFSSIILSSLPSSRHTLVYSILEDLNLSSNSYNHIYICWCIYIYIDMYVYTYIFIHHIEEEDTLCVYRSADIFDRDLVLGRSSIDIEDVQ